MVLRWIFKEFISKKKWNYIIGFAALIATSLLQTIIPKLLGYITDGLKYRTSTSEQIFWMTMGMLGLSVIVFGLKYVWRSSLIGRARDLECFLRAKLFDHFQSLPVKFYNEKKTGDLMSYAINDLSAVRMAFAFGLVFLVDTIVINLSSLAVMIKTINPLLTYIAMGPVLAAVFVVLLMRKAIRRRFTRVQEAFSNISEKVQENISGIRVVKGFVQEDEEIEKLSKASINRMDVQMNYVKLSALLAPAIQLCFGISFTLVLVVGSRYVIDGVITLGDFIAFNTYLGMLTGPVTNTGKVVETWQKAMASVKRLDDIFVIKTDIVDDNSAVDSEKFKGHITIKDLKFSYPGVKKSALKNIDIDLAEGKTLAVIGKTGSGKTTLVNLLLRLYKIERGHIFIDGKDINDIKLCTLRDNIGYVPQDNFLFSASIKENISFFKAVYTEEDVEEAARTSSVYDNIVDFPEGFETVVGERGITLSGGQKQRISIARAVIKDPSILVLDDSLSAVDTKTEEEILNNIKSILKGRTGIIIAHRISTIKHADEIIVLDKGRIVERGTHEELLAIGGHYLKLYNAQLAEADLNSEEELAV